MQGELWLTVNIHANHVEDNDKAEAIAKISEITGIKSGSFGTYRRTEMRTVRKNHREIAIESVQEKPASLCGTRV